MGKKQKGKEIGTYAREELANYLEDLAGQIRAGSLMEGDRVWSVPQEIHAKISVKEKKGRLAAKLSMGWSSLPDYDQKGRERVTSWKKSFKAAKKDVGRAFKNLQKCTEGGQLPDEGTLSGFIESAKAFSEMAHGDWIDQIDAFDDHLENLKRAAAEGRLDMMVHEIKDLRNQMAACHKEYK